MTATRRSIQYAEDSHRRDRGAGEIAAELPRIRIHDDARESAHGRRPHRPIDFSSPQGEELTETSRGHHHPKVEPPPGLDGREVDTIPVMTLMGFVAPDASDGPPSSCSSSSSVTSSSSDRGRKSGRKDNNNAKKNHKPSYSSQGSTRVKRKNIADKVIAPKVKEPDSIKTSWVIIVIAGKVAFAYSNHLDNGVSNSLLRSNLWDVRALISKINAWIFVDL